MAGRANHPPGHDEGKKGFPVSVLLPSMFIPSIRFFLRLSVLCFPLALLAPRLRLLLLGLLLSLRLPNLWLSLLLFHLLLMSLNFGSLLIFPLPFMS